MLEFIGATFLLIATPGPGVLSIAGVGSGFGFLAGQRFLWGLWLGNFLVGLAVIFGLKAVIFSVPYLPEALLGLSLAYLSYLAFKIAFAGTEIAFIKAERVPGFFDALALQAINPKAYAVNATFFTTFNFWPEQFTTMILIKILIVNAIWIPIHFGWLYAGASLRKLDLPPRVQRGINIFMALSMVIVVALAISSQS
jgi:threonine/homoserine/homoserine lactone efflux protein